METTTTVTYQDLGGGAFTMTTTTVAPFDPAAIGTQVTGLQAEVAGLQAQSSAAAALASEEATSSFQSEVDAVSQQITELQATLAAFTAAIPDPSQPSS